MRANRLSPTARVLLFYELVPVGMTDELRHLAGVGVERSVHAGEVLLAQDEVARTLWLSVDVAVERIRHGQTLGVFEPPTPVGVLDVMAGLVGTQLIARNDGLVLEFEAERVLSALLRERESLDTVLRQLGLGVAEFGTLLPEAALVPIDIPGDGPLLLVDRLQLLGANPLLHRLPLDLIAPIARRLEPIEVAAGQPLWSRGDDLDHGVVVARGGVVCTPEQGDAAVAAPGVTIGFLDSLLFGTATYDAFASEDTTVLTLPVDAIMEAMQTHPDLARAVVCGLARALVEVPHLFEPDPHRVSADRILHDVAVVR